MQKYAIQLSTLKRQKLSVLNSSFSTYQHKVSFHSRAVLAISSSIVFDSCKFENGYYSIGGKLHIEYSNFQGHTVFLGNTAYCTLGAMYAFRSQIHLNRSGTFVGKRIGKLYNNAYCDGTAMHVWHCNISILNSTTTRLLLRSKDRKATKSFKT